ncbi:proton motive ATPase, putative [Leishmania donovani]|uniref:HAD ATPase, P-type, IC family protein n=1 Tax=Leishmania donovani TaxID=5661 RepID=A0A3S5H5E7_LEIDO|nr:proton motive ATPase, putative [Leishmania donovani]AYU75892.1 proton motive ATPase, putative [Leishmania donovani]TPP51527.1 HAD ATPase, P-type, IC family protein [Leishmania donovani]CBZ31450.1 proton motive ATPase, putative [Leishmania donovani]
MSSNSAAASPVDGSVGAPESWLPLNSVRAPPRALDSTAVYEARQRFGMNEVRLTVAPLHRIVVGALLSPSTALVAAGAFVYEVFGGSHCLWFTLAWLVVMQVAVLVTTALVDRARVRRLQRCLLPGRAVAYREETWAMVGSAQLVPGDLVQLVAGSVVFADCSLYSGSVLIDMSDVTGRTRTEAVTAGQLLIAGTKVVDGAADAVVRYTGPETFVGQTIELVERLPHGFEERQRLSRAYAGTYFLVAAVAVTAEVVLFGALSGWDGYSVWKVARETTLLALLCTPLDFDLAVYVAVSRGASAAMQRSQAVLLRLRALLSLASVDMLLVDKTGTLSSGHCTLAAHHRAYLAGYPSRAAVVQLMALACRWRQPSLHATKRAVLRSADLDACDEYTQLDYVEHEGEHRSSALLRRRDGTLLRVTEGRLRSVLALVQHPESAAACVEAQRLVFAWSQSGLRCVAVAVAEGDDPWRLAGLLTFADPLRSDAAPLVSDCSRLGVAVTLISGDEHRAVAAAAEAVQLKSEVMCGRDVPPLRLWEAEHRSPASAMSVTVDLSAAANSASEYAACRAYAEMQPRQKAALVRALQQSGRVVAVLGDGVNDAAAARLSDVGIALLSAEQGQAAARGALWGADIALTSDHLGAVVELLVVSRELFGTIYSVFFWVTAAALQLSVLGAALAVAVPRRCAGESSNEVGLGLPPSGLHVLTLVYINGLTLMWVSTEAGDDTYWTAAPCSLSYRVALLQASTMAFIGLVGGVALGIAGGLACDGRGWWPLVSPSMLPVITEERLGGILTFYILYLNLFLTMSCASPVRAGWRFWRRSRLRVVLALAVVYGLYMTWAIDARPIFAACLCVYCGAVAVLQDMGKLTVHGICYCLGFRTYRACVDGMHGLQPHGRVDADEDAAAARPRRTTSTPSHDAAARRSSVPSSLNAVVGCIASLDVKLLCRARPTPMAPAE